VGFLSKLLKNDLVKMALPLALPYAMGPLFGSGIMGSMFSGMNPMARNMLQQSMLGYGTAALTGSKHPEKAAMYSGLASMPFSFMKASNAANLYNEQLADLQSTDPKLFHTKQLTPKIAGVDPWWEKAGPAGMDIYHPGVAEQASTWGMSDAGKNIMEAKKITPWDVLRGSEHIGTKTFPTPSIRNTEFLAEGDRWNRFKDENLAEAVITGTDIPEPEVDFYSKISKGGKNLLGQQTDPGKTTMDWLPTIASQAAGLYGGRATDEELWEDTKSRRRKELAFLYGVPEEMIGGEMQNPYYGGGGFWKDGGIATLEMDSGGAIDGPGGPKDDIIDAKLSDGEFVMTAKAVENFGGGDRLAGAKRMYQLMNQLDPESETVEESTMEYN